MTVLLEKKMINYDFLTNRNLVEVFLNKNRDRIFGDLEPVKVLSVNRSHTYNHEAYNVLLEVERKNKQFIRVSANESLSKAHDFRIMSFFYQSFKEKPFFCPKPLALLEPENILFYENAEGKKFTDYLDADITELKRVVSLLARLARRVHNLAKPNFKLFDPQQLFLKYDILSLEKEFPELSGELTGIINQNQALIAAESDFTLCHGDFNPNNFLVDNENIFVIDFDLTCFFHQELDLASFLTHLRMMLAQRKRLEIYEELEVDFLENYGDFDAKKLAALILLLDLRLLEISINYAKSGYDKKFLFETFKKDLFHNEFTG
jgi:thiamine kinase-like enzyme